MRSRNLTYYLSLPYTTQVVYYSDSGDAPPYMAQVPELPGCEAQGATEEEALAELREVKRLFIETMIEDGVEVPEPNGIPKPMKEYRLTHYVRSRAAVALVTAPQVVFV